ncbi:hypothetical protein [Nonomuraea sp. NPDC049784]|uniref:hypothetical protein n=1 Tax=Nonomuraea sp. NPDC049784 TaxID=3154361 RepID=UPI0033EDC875
MSRLRQSRGATVMAWSGQPFHSTERPVSVSAATTCRPMDAVVSDEPSNPLPPTSKGWALVLAGERVSIDDVLTAFGTRGTTSRARSEGVFGQGADAEMYAEAPVRVRVARICVSRDLLPKASHYHQQYLFKVPNGYCGIGARVWPAR